MLGLFDKTRYFDLPLEAIDQASAIRCSERSIGKLCIEYLLLCMPARKLALELLAFFHQRPAARKPVFARSVRGRARLFILRFGLSNVFGILCRSRAEATRANPRH